MFQLYKKKYVISENELNKLTIKGMENLDFYENIGDYERFVSFLRNIKFVNNLYIYNPSYGGCVGLECVDSFDNIFFINTNKKQTENINKNIELHHYNKDKIHFENSENKILEKSILYIENLCDNDEIDCEVLLTKTEISLENYKKYIWKENNLNVFVKDSSILDFEKDFKLFIQNNEIHYDNLLHLSMIVKDAGPQFRDFLIHNLPYIDRWTILDTGSTDDTKKYIKEILVGTKKGELYEEPFVNFEVSRNRALELTGTECKFIITLDDTYYLHGDLRKYLNILRDDVIADSFSIYICDETEYCSNRIIHSSSQLRYEGYIHEVISSHKNKNVQLYKYNGYIEDKSFNYMINRSKKRRELDLKLLFEELEKNPFNERTFYYLGGTYYLLGDYENAYKYYLKRLDFICSGYIQERYSAAMKLGRLCFFHLPNRKSETIGFFEKALQILPNRFEPYVYLGYFYLQNNLQKAYENLKNAAKIEFDIYNTQYDSEISLYKNELPKMLSVLCFEFDDFELGKLVCDFYLNNIDSQHFTFMKWRNIYTNLYNYENIKQDNVKFYDKKLLVIVSLNDFLPKELFDKLSNEFEIIYFGETLLNTQMYSINMLLSFIKSNYINNLILCNGTELLPVLYKSNVENIHLIFDEKFENNILIDDFKLKSVIIDNSHKNQFIETFNGLCSNKLLCYENDISKVVNNDKVIENFDKYLLNYEIEYKNFNCWKNEFLINSYMNECSIKPSKILMIGENTGTNSFHLLKNFSTIENITIIENWENDVLQTKRTFDKLLEAYKEKINIIQKSNIINELLKLKFEEKEFDLILIINDKDTYVLNILQFLLTENGKILVEKTNINFDNYKLSPFKIFQGTENFHFLQF